MSDYNADDFVKVLRRDARLVIKSVDTNRKLNETWQYQAADLIEQLQQRNAELETQVRSIALSRDELAATVERYERAITDALAAFNSQYHVGNNKIAVQMFEVLDIDMDENHESILNAVKREVYAEGYLHGYNHGYDVFALGSGHKPENENDLIEYANTKYPSVKDGE